MGLIELLTVVILTFLQRNYSSQRIPLLKYISHVFGYAPHHSQMIFTGMEARDRPPKRVLKQLEAIEAELQQPGVTNNSLVPEETTTCVDPQDAGPPQPSCQMTIEGDSKNTQPEQPHRYELRSRGGRNQT